MLENVNIYNANVYIDEYIDHKMTSSIIAHDSVNHSKR